MKSNPKANFDTMCRTLGGERKTEWVNLGGQLMRELDLEALRKDIGSQKLVDWEQIHNRYNVLWQQYPLEKQKHAYASLCTLLNTKELKKEQWMEALDRAKQIQEFVRDQVFISRKKDYDNPFRQNTYRNEAEMIAAIGTVEDNSFIRQVRNETDIFANLIDEMKKKL
jgi:hypothetical protein